MNRAMTVAAMGGLGLALVSASGVLLAPLGYRLGVWDVRFALLTLVKWATIASLAAFVVCLLAAVGRLGAPPARRQRIRIRRIAAQRHLCRGAPLPLRASEARPAYP